MAIISDLPLRTQTQTGIMDVDDRRLGISLIPSYDSLSIDEKELPSGFPMARWVHQSQLYLQRWRLYTGAIWDEKRGNKKNSSGEPVLKFPLQINHMKGICMRRNYTLWGEVPDGTSPLATSKVEPRLSASETAPTDDQKRLAAELEMYENLVWEENNGRTMQLESGLVAQYLGGTYYKLRYDPDNEDLECGLALETILADFVLPIWNTSNPNDLLELFVVYRMPLKEAELRFGVDNFSELSIQNGGPVYVEHWTKKKVKISIGGKPISFTFSSGEQGTETTLDFAEQDNPYGFIPFQYCPTERSGGWYGLSACDDTEGLMKEINARLADLGDAIRESSHRDIYVADAGRTISTIDMGGKREAIDLGHTGHESNAKQPIAFAIDPPSIAQGLQEYPEILRKQLGRDSFIPEVAEGAQEGSQRSALSMQFRMHPLATKARAMRTHFGDGLVRINRMIAKMAIYHGLGGITKAHIKNVKHSITWYPMLPRDEELITNKVNLAVSGHYLSPETAMQANLKDIVFDVPDEMKRVQAALNFEAELQMKVDAAKMKTNIATPQAQDGTKEG